ncbi:glycosyltransferase family 4 protein [Polaribacter haliotis]|uniref:Glycosyltransferase family 4 protein n=1 Tax=Polaribacter haliotis TaxID=1888915 RepID=A0A7L8AHW6_9FLAO|nr:glycosyltransferase family 4 protein [Polaribacter haliotis]QOD61524.1 glycosyltransferase family 4 protein [Polaribacter haliotis]
MKNKNIIGFITVLDPRDKTSWSGTHYRMLKALEKEFETVVVLGPIPNSRVISGIVNKIDVLARFFLNKKYNKEQNILKSWYHSKYINKRLKNKKIDLLFAPASSTALAFLNTKIPICTSDDATVDLLIDYHPGYFNFFKFSLIESKYIERKAASKVTYFTFSSEWASKDAIKKYKLKKKDVFITKYGANVDYKPQKRNILSRDYNSTIKILFLARHWETKGGPLVFEALKILLEKGYDVTLTVCGCTPAINHPKVNIIPFLNKNIVTQEKSFKELLYQTHLMFVPTRADCYGIAFCEASAFGIPVITTDTGGVSAVVENNYNGFTLPLDSNAEDYANKIQILLNNLSLINNMVINSMHKFEAELNWDSWGKKMKEILLSMSN